MSFELGIFTEYDDSNSIAYAAELALASAINLPPTLGVFWNDCGLFTEPTSNRKFEIYNRTETQRNGTIGTGGWDDTATTSLPVTSASGLIQGLVLNVDGEYVQILSVNTTANTISVKSRGTAGTTAAAHLVNVAYTVVGSAINDTDLKNIESVNEITGEFLNYMQTVAEPIDYTKGGLIDPRKGLSEGQMTILQKEAMNRIARNLAVASVLGKKQSGVKSGDAWMTAGLLQQLTDDASGNRPVLTYAASGVLTEAKLKAALREVFTRGMPTDMYVSYNNKNTINEFLGASAATKLSVNTDMGNTTAGYYVDSYNFEGNIVNVKVDISMPDDQIAIVNIAKCRKGWKDGDAIMLHNETPASSREFRDSLNGSFGIAIEDVGYDHILITGITQA